MALSGGGAGPTTMVALIFLLLNLGAPRSSSPLTRTQLASRLVEVRRQITKVVSRAGTHRVPLTVCLMVAGTGSTP
jgi:hypothetical protein